MYPPVGPVLIEIGPLALRWYGVLMVTAFIIAAVIAARYVERKGQSGNAVWDGLLWVMLGAIVGARLYYVFIQSPRGPNGLERYLANPLEILNVMGGGLHIFGGFIGGAIAVFLYARRRKLPLLIYLDGAALGMPLAQAIARLGNFINQELYGPPTTLPWGLRIDPPNRIPPFDDLVRYPESTRFHPLFLYEAIWNLVGFGLLYSLSRRFEKQLREGAFTAGGSDNLPQVFCWLSRLGRATCGRFLPLFVNAPSAAYGSSRLRGRFFRAGASWLPFPSASLWMDEWDGGASITGDGLGATSVSPTGNSTYCRLGDI